MVARLDDLHVDLRRLAEPDRQVGVEVALLERAVAHRQALGQDLARPPQRRALDLVFDVTRVDGHPHIHGDGQFADRDLARRRVDGHFGDAGDPGRALALLGGGHADPHAVVLGQALAPARLAGGDAQHVGEPRGAPDGCGFVGDPAPFLRPGQGDPQPVHVVVRPRARRIARIGDPALPAFARKQGEPQFERVPPQPVRHFVQEGLDDEVVVGIRHRAQRRSLHRPGRGVVIDPAHLVVRDAVPVVAAADGPLVDVAARTVVGVELQPVGTEFLADRKARSHVAAHDVVRHRVEGALPEAGAQAMQRRRARERGGEVRLAGLDEFHRPPHGAARISGGEDLVIVLLAAETAAEDRLMHDHVDLFRRLAEHVREVARESHARERRALRAGVDVPAPVRLPDRGVERLHRGVHDHVGGVFRLDGLPGLREGRVGVAHQDPRRAGFGVVGQRLVFVHQPRERDSAVRAGVPFDGEGARGLHRGREFFGDGEHPAGAFAPTVVDDHGADESGDFPRLGVVDRDRSGIVARAGNGERRIRHAGNESVDAVLRLAVGLFGQVERRRGLADNPPVPGILARQAAEIVGIGEGPVDLRLSKDVGVGQGAPGSAVDDAPVAGAAVGRVGAEQRRAGFDQHDAAGRAGARQAVELGGDAAAVDGVGEAVFREVLSRPFGVVERDLAPVDLELLGDDLGERGADMLAHLRLDDMDDGLSRRQHGEPDRGGEGRGCGRVRRARARRAEADGEDGPGCARRRADEEFAPRDSGVAGLRAGFGGHLTSPLWRFPRRGAPRRRCGCRWRSDTDCRPSPRRSRDRWGRGSRR